MNLLCMNNVPTWPVKSQCGTWLVILERNHALQAACQARSAVPGVIRRNVRCLAGFVLEGSGVATGTPLTDPPMVELLSEDPVLRTTKLISEAWDCDGLNQAHTLGPVCLLCLTFRASTLSYPPLCYC